MSDIYKSKIPAGQSGIWRVEKFTVPKQSLEGFRCAMQGRAVVPGEYTRLVRGSTNSGITVMSDTPAELRDLFAFERQVIQRDVRTVLINGLGLGCAVELALKNPGVKRVDVVEKSEDVILLVFPHLEDPRLFIHCDDALTKDWPKGTRWNVVWHDIWDNMPNSDDQPTITALKRKYGRRCDWQGVWCEGQSRY